MSILSNLFGKPKQTQAGQYRPSLVDHVLAGDIRSVDVDLGRGADPNEADIFGMPPLAASVGNDDVQITRMLVARGASPDTYAGKAAGHVLAMAAARGNTSIVKLLLQSGATVKLQDDDGWHALIFAAGAGDIEMVEALQSFGGDVNLSDHGGWTPLMQAAKYGRADLVQWLIAKGASVHARDKDGWTASTIAEKCGHHQIGRLLKS